MSVAASQAPSTGIEALLAATSSAPASKTSASAATEPGQTAPVADLFGQMLAKEVAQQAAAAQGAALDSTAAAAPAAGASKKVAAGKIRLAAEAVANTPDPLQHLTVADAAPVPAQYAWLPQSSQLAFARVAAGGSFSATSETGGGGSAGPAAAAPAGADAEIAMAAACLPGAASSAAAGFGQAFAGRSLSASGGEGPANPAKHAAATPATQPADPAQASGAAAGATAKADQASAAPQALPAIASATPDTTGEAVAGAVSSQPANSVSVSRTAASAWPATTALPDGPANETGRKSASLTENRVELRASELQAAKLPATEPPAAERRTVELRAGEAPATHSPATQAPTTEPAVARTAAEAAGGASDTPAGLFARLAARSGGQSSEQPGVTGAPGDGSAEGSTGQPGNRAPTERDALAFQALLIPVRAADRQFAAQATQEVGAVAAVSGASAGADSTPGSGTGLGGGRSGSPAPRDPRAASVLAQTGQASQTAEALAPPGASAESGSAFAPGASRSRGAAAAPASPAAASDAEPASATKPAAGGAAREIRLELRDADVRVNLRLVERAGGVQVDVRTPDSHLAASLRDELPTLAARLEQTGLRTESWHDAPVAAAARGRTAETTPIANAESSQNQSQGQGGKHNPQDDQPPEKRQKQPSTESKEFTWLYTSLT